MDSSFHQLWYPRKRWSFCDFKSSLEAAGGLKDVPKGRRLYRDYLAWLSADDGEQKRRGFEKMCKGWAKGSNDFKQAVLEDQKDDRLRTVVESEAKEMREPYWARQLSFGLKCIGKTKSDLKLDRKGAPWKVALARYLRERYLIPNRWLALNLSMGTANSLSSQISRHRRSGDQRAPLWKQLFSQENVD